MAERYLQIGDSEDMWIYDDSETAYALRTNGAIRAEGGVESVDLTIINGRLTTLEAETGLTGDFVVGDKTLTLVKGRITAIV